MSGFKLNWPEVMKVLAVATIREPVRLLVDFTSFLYFSAIRFTPGRRSRRSCFLNIFYKQRTGSIWEPYLSTTFESISRGSCTVSEPCVLSRVSKSVCPVMLSLAFILFARFVFLLALTL